MILEGTSFPNIGGQSADKGQYPAFRGTSSTNMEQLLAKKGDYRAKKGHDPAKWGGHSAKKGQHSAKWGAYLARKGQQSAEKRHNPANMGNIHSKLDSNMIPIAHLQLRCRAHAANPTSQPVAKVYSKSLPAHPYTKQGLIDSNIN